MKMLFPSSGSALGTHLGHSFFGMHLGLLQIRQEKDSRSTSRADAVSRAKLCSCRSGGGGGDRGWIRAAAGDRQDAAGG